MIDVARRHQIAIAKSTLNMSEVGARIMGGMDHAMAREVLLGAGWSRTRIRRYERVSLRHYSDPKPALDHV